jgi:ABC-2 type transport system ATP-binding protein
MSQLTIDGVSKRFGAFPAVSDLTLSVAPGEIFGFLGLNGAGKTTTIKMIAGLLAPTTGRVMIDGVDVHRDPVKAKAQLAYIPDDPYLYEKLTGREWLELVARLYRLPKDQTATRIDELLELLGIGDYQYQLTEGYSHGTKQKFIFAAAFLHRPQLMLIDEPMVGLDPQNAHLVKKVLRQIATDAGVSIFMSTHTLPLAQEICDRIGIIHQGKLVACGTLDDLRAQAKSQQLDLEALFLKLTGQYRREQLDW